MSTYVLSPVLFSSPVIAFGSEQNLPNRFFVVPYTIHFTYVKDKRLAMIEKNMWFVKEEEEE
jgi:hypothetical protein